MKIRIWIRVFFEALKRTIALIRQEYYYWEGFEEEVKNEKNKRR